MSQELDLIFRQQKEYSLVFGKTTYSERLQIIEKFRRMILANEQAIIDAHIADYGKPPAETYLNEIRPVLSEIRLIRKNLKNWMKPKSVPAGPLLFGSNCKVFRQSKGTVLVISPWNHPFALALVPVVSAIAAGNTVILKPSELTPNVSRLIGKLLSETFDSKLVYVAEGGKEIATTLLQMRFDHIFFTGSTHVGRVVALAAAKNLTPTTLELGGKSPTIIAHDADLQNAAEKIMWGKMLNCGQTCIAPDHVYVHSSVKDRFVQLCQEFLESRREFETSEKVRIISQNHRGRIESLLESSDAKNSNAKDPLRPLTQIVPLDGDGIYNKAIMKEEIFGPLLPLITYTDLDKVLDQINRHERPLALYIFSENKGTVEKVIQETRSGGVCANQVLVHVSNHHLPFGGIGESGLGNYHGEAGFRTFTHERAFLSSDFNRGSFKTFMPPYSESVQKLIRFVVRMGL